MNSYSFLVLFLQIASLTNSERIIWEDGTSTSNSDSDTFKNSSDYEIVQRKIKDDSESDYKNHHSLGKANNEIVSKQYYPQVSPYSPPQLAPPYGQYPSQFSNSGGGGASWEWSPSATTQQSRKPAFSVSVQFPGESYPVGPTSVNSYSLGSGTNYGRRNKTKIRGSSFSSSIRIDENCHCGTIPFEKDSKKLQRIVGGIVSKENSWPWMVSIAYTGQSRPFWFCGGSLISDKFVLTAAHCLRTIRNLGFSNIKLIMGTNNLNDSKSAVYYSIRAVRPHPLYKSGTEDYDVALLELKEKVNFTSKVAPICLKQESDSYVNRTVTVAGWGSLQNGEGPPADLREVDLKVVSNHECQKEYYYNYRTSITSAMLCAWIKGKDSCQGDSGGPLFLKSTSPPYAYTQIGIVSFGPPQCGTTTIPGVYSRVASAIRWIKSVTKIGKFCKGSF